MPFASSEAALIGVPAVLEPSHERFLLLHHLDRIEGGGNAAVDLLGSTLSPSVDQFGVDEPEHVEIGDEVRHTALGHRLLIDVGTCL